MIKIKINDFVISVDKFDCIEIFDNCILSGIQMTQEEAELVVHALLDILKQMPLRG